MLCAFSITKAHSNHSYFYNALRVVFSDHYICGQFMKLYEITEKFRELEALEDVPPEAMADTMEAIQGEFKEKGLAVLAASLNMEADVEQMKKHISAIQDRVKAIESRIDWMRDYLRTNMERCGITKIECPLFSASLGAESETVKVFDANLIPEEFIKTTRAPKKAEIKKAIKSGEDIPGAKIERGKKRLTIRK